MSFAATAAVRLRWDCNDDCGGVNSLCPLLWRALQAVSSTMGDSPDAAVPAATSDEAEATLRARAAAALAVSVSHSGAPVVGAALLSND